MSETPHGAMPRGLENTPRQRSYDGRFGRMFQKLAPAHDPANPDDQAELATIAASMRESADAVADNPKIPSGYVYLGQFVDHDITFDPTSQLQRRNDPDGLINFRTPRFDLDSVYGAGPDAQPFLYDQDLDGGHQFLLQNTFDMPRNFRGRALTGDPRNDENGIVSQLHVAFLRLHNRLMADLATTAPELSARDRFDQAQQQAQWHYQWVVAHDFLRRIIGDELHSRLLVTTSEPDGSQRQSVRLHFYRHKTNPYLPVEFSVAAYRYGHSQVRDEYDINANFHRRLFNPNGDDFRGFQPLRGGWQASWPFFFLLDATPPQLSRAINTSLSASLLTLQGVIGDDLSLRNLQRGAALGLPSGQAVAQAMGITPLADDLLSPASSGRAPLWFYTLREAQQLNDGRHLGPVGGRIVGETLLGLLRADPRSYLQLDPGWVPTLSTASGEPRSFEMADLLRYAAPDQTARF